MDYKKFGLGVLTIVVGIAVFELALKPMLDRAKVSK